MGERRVPGIDALTHQPQWRLDVLQQGLRLVVHYFRMRWRSSTGRSKPFINLQSTADDVDPEIDFSVGAVHFHRIRTSTDDLRLVVEDTGQPVMIVTTEPVGPDRGSTI